MNPENEWFRISFQVKLNETEGNEMNDLELRTNIQGIVAQYDCLSENDIVSISDAIDELLNKENKIKQTDKQVQELVDAVIDNRTSYVTTNRLSRAAKPFLPVKPQIGTVYYGSGESYKAIQLTDEVKAGLKKAGINIEEPFSHAKAS